MPLDRLPAEASGQEATLSVSPAIVDRLSSLIRYQDPIVPFITDYFGGSES
jgi:hypothetical protein